MHKWLLTFVFVVFEISFSASRASAMPEFKAAFKKKYIDTSKLDDFKSLANKTSCDVCHVKGAKKTVQNAYGKALNKLIEGDAADRKKSAKAEGGSEGEAKEKVKLLAELEKAFEEVAKMKAPDGTLTYGELIKEGKLPVPVDEAVSAYKKEMEEKGEKVDAE